MNEKRNPVTLSFPLLANGKCDLLADAKNMISLSVAGAYLPHVTITFKVGLSAEGDLRNPREDDMTGEITVAVFLQDGSLNIAVIPGKPESEAEASKMVRLKLSPQEVIDPPQRNNLLRVVAVEEPASADSNIPLVIARLPWEVKY